MNPARILVVEDETIIGLMIQDALEEMGYAVLGPAARVERALALIDQLPPDAALLDVNLSGEQVYPVAEVLGERGVPFVFLTGYGAAGIRPEFKDRMVLAKPFDPARLRGVLRQLCGR